MTSGKQVMEAMVTERGYTRYVEGESIQFNVGKVTSKQSKDCPVYLNGFIYIQWAPKPLQCLEILN